MSDQTPTGRYIQVEEGVQAFIPNRLPKAIDLPRHSVNLLATAQQELGTLKGNSEQIPNPYLFVSPYLRKEAVLSSRIEGTRTSLSEVLEQPELFGQEEGEASLHRVGRSSGDLQEVLNHIRAAGYGMSQLQEEQFPLCLRLLKKMHKILMADVRGKNSDPGEFRRMQNYISLEGRSNVATAAVYVPPPSNELKPLLDDWEKQIHNDDSMPGLVQCALLHGQFEMIHPFIDGNGRIGRLFITLFLCHRRLLTHPMLYLSGFFEKNREAYFRYLSAISREADWIGWIDFFLEAVATQAKSASLLTRRLMDLQVEYRDLVQRDNASASVLSLVEALFMNPYITIPRAEKAMSVSYMTARSAVQRLQRLGILKERGERKRNKQYVAHEVAKLLIDLDE